MSTGQPMARYAAARRVGDFVFMSGVVAVNPATRDLAAHGDWQRSDIFDVANGESPDLVDLTAARVLIADDVAGDVVDRVGESISDFGAIAGDDNPDVL